MKSLIETFGTNKAFIGMVHLRPTTGYPNHPGMAALIDWAVGDAVALQKGGAHGICIENDNDQPHTILISDAQKQCVEEATKAVQAAVTIPVGIGILLNDWKAALDIAKATNAAFVRIDVFVDRVDCPAGQGVIEPEAEKIVAYRKAIGAENVAIFADIQVKHKILLEVGKPLTLSAQQAFDAGADAVTVTGTATGQETPLEDVRQVKKAFPDRVVLIGAGVNAANVQEQFEIADGAFVGSSLKTADDHVDEVKVRAITDLISVL